MVSFGVFGFGFGLMIMGFINIIYLNNSSGNNNRIPIYGPNSRGS